MLAWQLLQQPSSQVHSTQDSVTQQPGGLSSEPVRLQPSSIGSIGGRVAEVGWKFTSLAWQKAAELRRKCDRKGEGRQPVADTDIWSHKPGWQDD